MAGIFGVALRGLGMLGRGRKVSKTIKSVPPSKRNKTFGEQKEKISKTVDKQCVTRRCGQYCKN